MLLSFCDIPTTGDMPALGFLSTLQTLNQYQMGIESHRDGLR
jgi:hypothetical protein